MAKGLNKTVALVGMMGAGKTAVGKALAAELDVPFLDSDAEIEKAADRSIAEIFEEHGEAFFRARESEIIGRLLDSQRAILSTGGGAYLSAENRAMMSQRGVVVWLKADLDLLWSRVRHKTTRPLLQTDTPYETLKGLVEAREPFYAQADVIVESEPGLSIEHMAEKVIRALAGRGGILEVDQ